MNSSEIWTLVWCSQKGEVPGFIISRRGCIDRLEGSAGGFETGSLQWARKLPASLQSASLLAGSLVTMLLGHCESKQHKRRVVRGKQEKVCL